MCRAGSRRPWGPCICLGVSSCTCGARLPLGGAGGALRRRPRLWATMPFLPGCRAPRHKPGRQVGAQVEVERTAQDGGTPRERQRGSGRGWALLSGRDSVWVTKLRQDRTGAHVGLTGLLGAGATCGLHPGRSPAGKQGARECRPRAGWKALPKPVPGRRPWPQQRSQAPKGAGWGDIPTQASALDPAPLPTACRDFQRLINNLGGGVAGPACRETFQAKLPTPQSRGNTHAELPRANRTREVHSRTQRDVASDRSRTWEITPP